MKTANEIKQIIRQWWEWNSTMAQLPGVIRQNKPIL